MCNMTHPDILKTEALGLPEPDEQEDWQDCEQYAAKVKKDHCGACVKRAGDKQFCEFQYPHTGPKHRITINCKTCKKHKKGTLCD